MTDTPEPALETVAWRYHQRGALMPIFTRQREPNSDAEEKAGWTETPLCDANTAREIIAGLQAEVERLKAEADDNTELLTIAYMSGAANARADKPKANLLRQFCTVPEPHGDCWRACLATITGLDAAKMPNFVHAPGVNSPDDTTKLAREWLKPYGLTIFDTFLPGDWSLQTVLKDASAINPGTAFILSGRAAHVEDSHAVVVLNGMIAHDPSGAGLSGPCRCACGKPECQMKIWGVWLIVPIVEDRPDASQGAEVRQAPTVTIPREVVEEAMKAVGKITPIRVHDGRDYAEVFFSDGSTHSTQAMTMNPQDWIDLATALAKLKEATDVRLSD